MADLDIHYDPITVNSNPATVNINGLDDTQNTIVLQTPQPLKSDTKSEFVFPQPFKTDSKTEISFPQPIRAESRAELDIKPLVFDQCLAIRLEPLPPTRVRQPYQTRFGFTVFGVELFGFSLEGENQTIVTGLPHRPQVAWGGEQPVSHAPSSATRPAVEDSGNVVRVAQPAARSQATSAGAQPRVERAQPRTSGTLRIRLGE